MQEIHSKDNGDNLQKRSIAVMYIITAAVFALVILVSIFAVISANRNKGEKTVATTASSLKDETELSPDKNTVSDDSEVLYHEQKTEGDAAPDFTVTDLSAVMYASINLNVRSIPNTSGGVIGSFKKGAQVTVTGKCSNGWYRVNYNDTSGYCSGKYLSSSEIPAANATESSPAPQEVDLTKPYYLKVNLTQNIVTVYGKNENGLHTVPVKAMYCSTGLNGKTPVGTYNSSNKYRWKILSGDVYGQYCTRITGHILFHSVPYNTQDNSDLNYNKYNKLGSAASAGCIRLSTADAKWIYDNCPSGTTVTTYYSGEPEPISPPAPVRIDVNDPRRGWDPTDPDPNNPWIAQ